MRIAYKLTLKACPAEQPDCGPPDEFKPKTPPATANQPSSPAAQQPAAPQSPPQFLDASAPADRTQASITPNSLASQIKPVGFADPAFEQLWQRSDLPVARSRVTRGWMWGPTVRVTRTENYTEASGGQRLVLYFDKGRMELNSPAGGQGWLVSSGLLAQELISGRLQLGNSTYDNRSPADIGIVGDVNDPRAPTYASLTGLLGRAADRSGQTPRESLDRNGQVGSFTGSSFPETRLSYFATNTGHNIPSVFWNYLNARGPIYQRGSFGTGIIQDWVSMIGYPISEPYWTRVYVGGIERDVLVQAFERRILTYSPSETAGWRVQLGNIGQHYYRWRYDEDLPS
jgi:hypothetical protein